jgi:hypothetical protein
MPRSMDCCPCFCDQGIRSPIRIVQDNQTHIRGCGYCGYLLDDYTVALNTSQDAVHQMEALKGNNMTRGECYTRR